jgi:hypothetical protein
MIMVPSVRHLELTVSSASSVCVLTVFSARSDSSVSASMCETGFCVQFFNVWQQELLLCHITSEELFMSLLEHFDKTHNPQ